MSWWFSAVCMVIIATVLAHYDGKPVPKWKLGPFSIGAFISVFSGFAKSALLLPTAEALGQLKWDWFRGSEKKILDFERLDSASRGPWGSFVLLIRTRRVTLATIGAAIVLLSLPLDGLFQQIVSYPETAVLDSTSKATISRAILYDPSPGLYWNNGTYKLPPDLLLDGYLKSFWQGDGLVPAVEFDCSTGNCTYDSLYTLGLDFQCQEMPSSFLEFGCRNTSAEWLSTVAYVGPGLNPNVTSCGWYLNPGDGAQSQLMTGYEVQVDGSVGEVLSTRFFPLMDLATNEKYFGGYSPSFHNTLNNPVADFILAATPGGFVGTRKNVTPVVTECEIHWAVNLLKATVVSGLLSEELLDTIPFKSNDPDNPSSPWDPLDGSVWVANFSMTLADPQSVATGGVSTFVVDNTTAFKVWEVWSEIVPSTITLPADDNPFKSGPVFKSAWWMSPPLLHQVNNVLKPSPWAPPNNVTQHMADAVLAMNQVIRRNVNSQKESHDVAVGQAFEYVQLVKVRWAWIAMPLALLTISGVFLLATVLRSAKDKNSVGIWKTSALASLFHGLGEDAQKEVETGETRRGHMNSKAKDLRVRFSQLL